jgi:protein-S-isoprenylcysteine O-methyltransferase Ste14
MDWRMAKSTGKEDDHPGVIAPPPVIYAGTAIAALLLHWLLPVGLPAFLMVEEIRFGVGAVLVVVSITLAMIAVRRFRKAGTNVPPWQPATTIVETGPYRFTRNPMYLGLTGFYLGIGLIVASVWFAVLFVPMIIVMQQGVILREETYLARKFGDAYLAYKTRVRRWI